MPLSNFFDVPEHIEDTSCYPIYTELNFPEWLSNMTWNKIREMNEEQFADYIEQFRIWALERYTKDRHPVIAGSKSVSQIKRGFKKFNGQDVGMFYGVENGIKYITGSSNIWGSGVNHWFPEIAETEISHSWPKSIIDFLNMKEYVLKSLRAVLYEDSLKTFRKEPNRPIYHSLVKVLKITRGVQVATNFPPHIAKWIYINFLQRWEDENLFVYDPCMGWGGRMIGLFSAASHISLHDKHINFIGTDVNTNTHERFQMLYDFWHQYVSPLDNLYMKKHIVPAEDMEGYLMHNFGKGHLAFTSPPYFNKEKYSNDDTQSYIRYKTYDEWTKGFLYGMIENVSKYLRPGGHFVLNVANVADTKKNGKYRFPIQNDAIEIAESMNLKLVDRLHMLISLIAGKSAENHPTVTVKGIDWKFEPMMVFQKGE